MPPPPNPTAQHTSQKPVGEPKEAQRTARKHWRYWAASTWGENKRAGSCWLSREMANERLVCRFARNQPQQRMSCTSSPDIPKHLAPCSWADAVQLWGARSVRTLLLIVLAPNLALEVIFRRGYFPSQPGTLVFTSYIKRVYFCSWICFPTTLLCVHTGEGKSIWHFSHCHFWASYAVPAHFIQYSW